MTGWELPPRRAAGRNSAHSLSLRLKKSSDGGCEYKPREHLARGPVESALIPDTRGLRGDPECRARPQDPGTQTWEQTPPFSWWGLPLKHVFTFSVFERFLLPKNVHLKKKYFSFQFLSSVSLFQFRSVSFKYLFFLLLLLLLLNKMKRPH